jgi:hypothetical protein
MWSASGYLPVRRIEEVVETARAEIYVPARLGDYLDISFGLILLAPSGRWAEADAIIRRMTPKPLEATAVLALRPLAGLQALRRGELGAADAALDGLLRLSLESGEAQRTVPSAGAVFPWLGLQGRNTELRESAGALIGSVEDEWPNVYGCHGIVRALAAAGEWDALRDTLASMRRARAYNSGRLRVTLAVGDALLHLASGDPEASVELLRGAAARDEELGFAYDVACLRLDLARALDAAAAAEEAADVRAQASRVLEPLRCVNPV